MVRTPPQALFAPQDCKALGALDSPSFDKDPSAKRKKKAALAAATRLSKSRSAGTSPCSTPLAGRGPGGFVAPAPALGGGSRHQQHEDKGGVLPVHNAKASGKKLGECGRLWYVSQALLLALVLAALCSLLFFTVAAPRLAQAQEPLVLMHKGGKRLVVRVHSKGEQVDPLSDITHPRLAGRRELMRFLTDPRMLR